MFLIKVMGIAFSCLISFNAFSAEGLQFSSAVHAMLKNTRAYNNFDTECYSDNTIPVVSFDELTENELLDATQELVDQYGATLVFAEKKICGSDLEVFRSGEKWLRIEDGQLIYSEVGTANGDEQSRPLSQLSQFAVFMAASFQEYLTSITKSYAGLTIKGSDNQTFRLGAPLGAGGFAQVYEGLNTQTSEKVAVKFYHSKSHPEIDRIRQMWTQMAREMDLQHKQDIMDMLSGNQMVYELCKEPKLVLACKKAKIIPISYVGPVVIPGGKVEYVVVQKLAKEAFDFAYHFNFQQYMFDSEKLSEYVANFKNFVQAMGNSLTALGTQTFFCHGDMKIQNVVMQDGNYYIVDWDWVVPVGYPTQAHTVFHKAPELSSGGVCGNYSDLYSIGVSTLIHLFQSFGYKLDLASLWRHFIVKKRLAKKMNKDENEVLSDAAHGELPLKVHKEFVNCTLLPEVKKTFKIIHDTISKKLSKEDDITFRRALGQLSQMIQADPKKRKEWDNAKLAL